MPNWPNELPPQQNNTPDVDNAHVETAPADVPEKLPVTWEVQKQMPAESDYAIVIIEHCFHRWSCIGIL